MSDRVAQAALDNARLGDRLGGRAPTGRRATADAGGTAGRPGHRVRGGVARRRDRADAVLTRTDPVVGVSNVFAADPASDDGWADLPAVVARHVPGLPLVGYERGVDPEAAQRHGFTPIGPLRVWVPPAA